MHKLYVDTDQHYQTETDPRYRIITGFFSYGYSNVRNHDPVDKFGHQFVLSVRSRFIGAKF